MSGRGHQGILLANNGKLIVDLPFDGANNSTVMTDSTGRAWTVAGAAKLSTAQSVAGGSSLLLPGTTSDYISTAQTADLEFGNADFDMVGYIRPANVTTNQAIAANWHGVASNFCAWLLYLTNTGKLQLSVGYGSTNAGTPSTTSIVANVWTKVRAFRRGAALGYEINDVPDAATYNIGTNTLNSFAGEPTRVGYANGLSGFNGYIDQFQIRR